MSASRAGVDSGTDAKLHLQAIAKVITPIAEFTAEAGYEAKEAAEPLAQSVKKRIDSFSSPAGSRRSSMFGDIKPPMYDSSSTFTGSRRESLSGSAITEEPGGYDQPPAKRASQSSKGFFQRLILASEVVLTSLEATTANLINSGTEAAASAAE